MSITHVTCLTPHTRTHTPIHTHTYFFPPPYSVPPRGWKPKRKFLKSLITWKRRYSLTHIAHAHTPISFHKHQLCQIHKHKDISISFQTEIITRLHTFT